MSESREPKRVQLRRSKGWKKPEGVVVVSRPSRFGNPLRLSQFDYDHRATVEWFAVGLDMRRAGTLPVSNAFWRYPDDGVIRHMLRGHDLACWCPLDQPCHADVLLELANAAPSHEEGT